MADYSLDSLYPLKKADTKRTARMLARAFVDDPLMLFAYGVGDKERSSEGGYYYFQIPLKYCLRYGEVYAPTSDIEGAAAWMPSSKWPITFWKMMRVTSIWLMMKMVCKFGIGMMNRMMPVGRHLDETHKRLAPSDHFYLQTLGVDPEHQGKGYASRLLKPMFARLDEEGMPCYLETFTEKDVQIYSHFGFDVLEESEVRDTGITSWAMLRQPG